MAVTISGSGQIVKQVVSFTTATQYSTSSITPVSTGLTVTITPTNSANKILVFCNIGTLGTSGSSTGQEVGAYLYRGASAIPLSTSIFSEAYVAGIGTYGVAAGFNYLDSPATTLATTYTVYLANLANNGVVYLNRFGNDTSTITLMEIAYA